tara:strand:- start:30 stop:485 length:456 start_codon:yes stop_codon:yes gene_type:complete
MKIFLNNFEESGSKITKNQVSKILNQVVEEAGFKKEYFDNKELSISCVSEEESKTLNKKYRGKNKSTNVLSFSLDKNLTKDSLIGDIILCIEIIKKEAKEYSKDFENRLKHMIIHGFLHLLNFEHKEKHERLKMEDLEITIMKKISAGEPY